MPLLFYFLYNVVIICTGWLLFVQVVIFFVQVVIFWTGGYFSCAGGYFLDRWLFFVYRWLFFCTEGLCVYNGHSYFGYFAQMKYNVLYDMSDVLQVGGAEERGSSGRGGEA